MTKLFSLGTFLIPTLFVSACAASAQNNTPAQNYVFPTNHISDYYKRLPLNEQAYELIAKLPKRQCEKMKAKAVENYNEFNRAMKNMPHTNEIDYPFYNIIGEHIFIKYYGCAPDLKTSNQNVVSIGLDSKEQIEREKKTGRRTMGQITIYTFFDKKGNVVRWGGMVSPFLIWSRLILTITTRVSGSGTCLKSRPPWCIAWLVLFAR